MRHIPSPAVIFIGILGLSSAHAFETRIDEQISLKQVEKIRLTDTHLKDVQIMQKGILANDLSNIFVRGFQHGFKDGGVCTTPFPISSSQIDPHRSLMVHDSATLSEPTVDFSLERTLGMLATQVATDVPGTTAGSIFKQMWDTQNDTGTAQIAGGIHCDDNAGTINGFPVNNCPRSEGNEAATTDLTAKMAEYKPSALVNRLDLSHKGWKNCGEHRIIYSKDGAGITKNLVIFEAVLPNPFPGCRSGCRDVVEFWSNLSNDSDPVSRSGKLENFFYNGLPGFSPVVNVNHYSSSATASFYAASESGQIRTNQFLQQPWLLKEFKTQTTCVGSSCDFDIVPISVKANPYGELWNKDIANSGSGTIPGLDLLATNFQADTLAQVTDALLGNPDINAFSYAVDADKNAADSNAQGNNQEDNYRLELINQSTDNSFENAINTAGGALTTSLTKQQIANRATALSCAGCHQPGAFGLSSTNAIGPGQSWPASLSFVHVDVNPNVNLSGTPGFDVTKFNGNPNGFDISDALLNTFLPARENNLVTEYNKDICNCEPNLINVFQPDFGFIFKQQLVFIDAVKNLTNPEIHEIAKKELLMEEERFNRIKKPGMDEIQKSLHFRKEILTWVDRDMLENPNLKSLNSTLTRSNKLL
ncbi:MAG: hypothetical protein ACN4GM_02335, partial [Gammaproteobacteria bacterium]